MKMNSCILYKPSCILSRIHMNIYFTFLFHSYVVLEQAILIFLDILFGFFTSCVSLKIQLLKRRLYQHHWYIPHMECIMHLFLWSICLSKFIPRSWYFWRLTIFECNLCIFSHQYYKTTTIFMTPINYTIAPLTTTNYSTRSIKVKMLLVHSKI
jgi:hypothetical protein